MLFRALILAAVLCAVSAPSNTFVNHDSSAQAAQTVSTNSLIWD